MADRSEQKMRPLDSCASRQTEARCFAAIDADGAAKAPRREAQGKLRKAIFRQQSATPGRHREKKAAENRAGKHH